MVVTSEALLAKRKRWHQAVENGTPTREIAAEEGLAHKTVIRSLWEFRKENGLAVKKTTRDYTKPRKKKSLPTQTDFKIVAFRKTLGQRRDQAARVGIPQSVVDNYSASLKPQTCRYISGELSENPKFCSSKVVPGRPYCLKHCQVCYVAVKR
jgi:hypothetical protein